MLKVWPNLYKRTSAGKVQVWFVEQDEDRYRTTSGQLEGKKTTTEWTVAKPKNVGKANATTGAEQATAEIEAAYKKKSERDYHYTVDTVDVAMRFNPMLAKKWEDEKHKIFGTFYVQPKLDGIRCIVNKDGMWTRNGKPILSAPHIILALKPAFDRDPELIFDGELYNHDLKDNFDEITSIVKQTKPTEADFAKSARMIQYWVYDLASAAGSFHNRFNKLLTVLPLSESVKVTRTTTLLSVDAVDEIGSQALEEGFEGVMIRHSDSSYENKRSTSLLKWKVFQDEEFTIVDVLEGKGNRSGMAASILLRLPNGETFNAGIIGNEAYCIKLLNDKAYVIGQQGTVRFQNYTPGGVPRFPKFKGVRIDA